MPGGWYRVGYARKVAAKGVGWKRGFVLDYSHLWLHQHGCRQEKREGCIREAWSAMDPGDTTVATDELQTGQTSGRSYLEVAVNLQSAGTPEPAGKESWVMKRM